jgi:hypothetical protein
MEQPTMTEITRAFYCTKDHHRYDRLLITVRQAIALRDALRPVGINPLFVDVENPMIELTVHSTGEAKGGHFQWSLNQTRASQFAKTVRKTA